VQYTLRFGYESPEEEEPTITTDMFEYVMRMSFVMVQSIMCNVIMSTLAHVVNVAASQ
jgi:hypothetical protein